MKLRFQTYIFFSLFFVQGVFAIGKNNPEALDSKSLQLHQEFVQSKIGIDEHLGKKIDLNNTFTDESGNTVALGKYFNEKPVFLVMVYYECPTLCSLHLNALVDTFKSFDWNIGDKFEFVAVSIDPEESYKLAAKKVASYQKVYDRPGSEKGWHFLTGSEANIKKLAKEVGFKYAWNPREQQWAHSAAAYVLTPQGKLSYYHYGIQIKPKVLRLSLVEAADNKIGSLMDKVLLFCLQYDPDKKTYAFYALNIVRVGGVITLMILIFFLVSFWRREMNKQVN